MPGTRALPYPARLCVCFRSSGFPARVLFLCVLSPVLKASRGRKSAGVVIVSSDGVRGVCLPLCELGFLRWPVCLRVLFAEGVWYVEASPVVGW